MLTKEITESKFMDVGLCMSQVQVLNNQIKALAYFALYPVSLKENKYDNPFSSEEWSHYLSVVFGKSSEMQEKLQEINQRLYYNSKPV